MSAQSDVLLLNTDYQPLKVLPWSHAITLYLSGKVAIVEAYADKFIHSAGGMTLPWPAVVVLRQFAKMSRKVRARIRFRRQNVHARDSWTCCYCGCKPLLPDGRPDTSQLTLDHVVPRSQAKTSKVTLPWNGKSVPVTCWENVVSSCKICNFHKADRTPEQAGMKLRYLPRQPNGADIVRMVLSRLSVPAEWADYLEA